MTLFIQLAVFPTWSHWVNPAMWWAAVLFALVACGPGAWSLDRLLGLEGRRDSVTRQAPIGSRFLVERLRGGNHRDEGCGTQFEALRERIGVTEPGGMPGIRTASRLSSELWCTTSLRGLAGGALSVDDAARRRIRCHRLAGGDGRLPVDRAVG